MRGALLLGLTAIAFAALLGLAGGCGGLFVLDEVGGPDAQLAHAVVDLRTPEVSVHVEIVLEVHAQLCCLSVLPRWHALDEYRLPRAAVEEAVEDIVKDAQGSADSVGLPLV